MSSFTWPLGRPGRPEPTSPGRWPWSTRSGATAAGRTWSMSPSSAWTAYRGRTTSGKGRRSRWVTGSGLPFTIQRATQFHDLVLTGLACAAYAPVMVVPAKTSCQPVDAADVADRLAQIVWSGPADGYGADLGGPQVLDATELARQVLAAMEVRRPVRRIRLPGRVAAGFRAGHHLAADTPRGKRTRASYLAARLAAGGGEVIGWPFINKQVRIRHR